jgi:hypothetical protein
MKGPTILGLLVIAVMSTLMANILIHDGMDHGVGFDVFNAGAGNPWQLFINNDLVTGLLFMCGWIIFREKGGRVIDTVCWVWMVLWWGNIIVAAYVLRAAWQSAGDWSRFFLGQRTGALRPLGVAVPLRVLFVLLAVAVAVWTGLTIKGTGIAPVPTFGLVLGFAPIVLTLLLLAAPARTVATR